MGRANKITKGVVSLHVRYNTNIQLNAVIWKKKTLCVARPNFILRPHFYSLLWFETDETPQDQTKIHLSVQIVENSLHRFTESCLQDFHIFAPKQTLVASPNFHAQFPFIFVNLEESAILHFDTLTLLDCFHCLNLFDIELQFLFFSMGFDFSS